MILKSEIGRNAQEWNVPPMTVDKDWALGHFLCAFFLESDHLQTLMFKGGTCLRKCYFPGYRFSEDLDFTAINLEYRLTDAMLKSTIERATDHSGILFHAEPVKEMIHKDERAGDQVRIRFWGANHRKDTPPPADPGRWHDSIKLEITNYEQIVFEPVHRQIYHEYSDHLSDSDIRVPCYDLREAMAEKIRALIQRSYTAPRDFYDIWMLKDHFNDVDWISINQAFHQKMDFKGHTYHGVNQLINDTSIDHVTRSWDQSLAHQIPSVNAPNVIVVFEVLRTLLSEKITRN